MQLVQVTLACADVPCQIEWFSRHGWSTTADSITVGYTTLRMTPSSHTHAYHYAMAVPANSVSAAARWCQQQQIPLIAGVNHPLIYQFEEWGMQAIYFLDGAGNVAEFIGAYDATLPACNEFDLSMIHSVSEIGLVTPHVTTIANVLKDTYALESFYSYNHTFHPVGDAEGRVIIVEPSREWYPSTGVFSTCDPLELTFVVNNCTYHAQWNQ
ncbi:MAG: hypothetical protein ACO3F2_11385 [Roseiflexaceae bacterium]|jgi:hypothetical protein